MAAWDDTKYVAFDVESSGELPEYGLQPYRVQQGKSWLTSFAYAHCINADNHMVSGGYAVPGLEGCDPKRIGSLSIPDTTAQLAPWLTKAVENKLTVVTWNGTFDIAWLIAYGFEDQVMQLNWLDGMLLWRHLDIEPEYDTDRSKKRSYSLKEAVRQFLPKYAGYEEEVDFHSMEPDMVAKRFKYNKKDTAFTLTLTKMFYNQLAQEPQRLKAAILEAQSLPVVASSIVQGMAVDIQHTEKLHTDLTKVADECLEKLAPHGVSETVVRSPKQLASLLFDSWGLPIIKVNVSKKTGNTTNSTDKEVLHELSFLDPRAKVLRQYREALNNQTKFPKALMKSVQYNSDGRTHPAAMVFGTYTGRMTYSSKQGKGKEERQTGFALHQMKRGKDFRSEIVAPEDYTICEFDAAGQEFRWMAIASNDETMLQLCQPGEDPHGFMGAQILGRDYREMVQAVHDGDKAAKDGRQLGKVANLSLQYRTSARKLRSVARVQYNLPMELPEARQIRKIYLQSYTGVPRYWDEQIYTCSRKKYVETFAGRRVQLLDDFNGDHGWQLASTTINYRIQGTGADQKYLALAVLRPYMVRHGIYFAWELHDGLYLYVPDAKVEKCVPEIQRMLAALPYKKAWNFVPPIPLPWDAKTGKSWGTLEEWRG